LTLIGNPCDLAAENENMVHIIQEDITYLNDLIEKKIECRSFSDNLFENLKINCEKLVKQTISIQPLNIINNCFGEKYTFNETAQEIENL